MYLTEVEDIKKRWQEYTEERYKKESHEEPDILESLWTKLVEMMEFQLR